MLCLKNVANLKRKKNLQEVLFWCLVDFLIAGPRKLLKVTLKDLASSFDETDNITYQKR